MPFRGHCLAARADPGYTQKIQLIVSTIDEMISVAHSTAKVVARDSNGESDCGAPGGSVAHPAVP